MNTQAPALAGTPATLRLAGRQGEQECLVVDYFDRLTGRSLWDTDNSTECAQYAYRAGLAGLPRDDRVVVVDDLVGRRRLLVHESELEAPDGTPDGLTDVITPARPRG